MQPIEQSGVKTKSTPKTASNSRKKLKKTIKKSKLLLLDMCVPQSNIQFTHFTIILIDIRSNKLLVMAHNF
jgi:hypothetical protein